MIHTLYQCFPFTYKSRSCNSCGMKYQKDCALSLYSKLINCSHIHIVFTIPYEFRNIFIIN
ncbi:MAG: transposase zinc-binding domain-containing protein [Clostridiales bacterium]|nr:transposase zinc-binding domain-containing protein [Clostridiales bacterium]